MMSPPQPVPPMDMGALHIPERELPIPQSSEEEAPFVVEHIRLDEEGGHFTPAARLYVTSAIRALTRSLSDESAKALLILLSFLRPSGRCEGSVSEIAAALSESETAAKARMTRLMRCTWNGASIIHDRYSPSGVDGFVLDDAVVTKRVMPETQSIHVVSAPPDSREKVLSHSREMYGRPRAEVERIVAEQLGYSQVGTTGPEAEARRAMEVIGVPREQINVLLENYPIERITEQIDWLPHRHAREPAKLLVAAIQHNYDPPAYIRLQQAIAAEPETTRRSHATTLEQPDGEE